MNMGNVVDAESVSAYQAASWELGSERASEDDPRLLSEIGR